MVAPAVVAHFYIPTLDTGFNLMQPNSWKNNDTLGSSDTGTALGTAAATGDSATASATAAAMRRAYFYYDS